MGSIKFAAEQVINNCLRVKRGERLIMITDHETERIADAILTEAKRVGAEIEKFMMEDFGERPEDGKNPLEFPQAIADALASAQVSLYVASVKEGERPSFRAPLLDLLDRNAVVRHAHMVAITEEIMCQGMSTDYIKVHEITQRVFDIVSKAREIRVTTPAGSDFTARFDPKYRWVASDGNIPAGLWCNLPDGEVFTCPADANGRVAVDGCLGDFLIRKYGDIQKTPLRFELRGGRCVRPSISCSRADIKGDFEKFTFGAYENSDRLGEFGIGTNVGISGLIGNLLQDEKFPGVHIALGDPYPAKTGAPWACTQHDDCVLRDCTILVDGTNMIMDNGRFLI